MPFSALILLRFLFFTNSCNISIFEKVFYSNPCRCESRPKNASAAGRAPSTRPPKPNAVQSLDRALRILAIVAEADGLSLSEVAARSRARRLDRLPHADHARGPRHGRVRQDRTSSGRSASRPTAWARPSCAAASSSTAPASVMQELMEKTGETANLGVAEDDCVVFVSQVETHQAIRAFFRPGTRSPFHASRHRQGDPRASRAGARHRDRTQGPGWKPSPTRRSRDAAVASRDLAEIRARGWSVDDEERHPGMRCVAAAIFNEFGEPVGGISVSGPTVRVTPERLAAIGPLVRERRGGDHQDDRRRRALGHDPQFLGKDHGQTKRRRSYGRHHSCGHGLGRGRPVRRAARHVLAIMAVVYQLDSHCGTPGDSGGCEMGMAVAVFASAPARRHRLLPVRADPRTEPSPATGKLNAVRRACTGASAAGSGAGLDEDRATLAAMSLLSAAESATARAGARSCGLRAPRGPRPRSASRRRPSPWPRPVAEAETLPRQ